MLREITLRTGKRPSFRPQVVQLEQRITPVTRSTVASIVNASPVIFTNQYVVAAQWTLDTTTTYGTVVCFQFAQQELVANTHAAYLEHLRNGRWVRIEAVRPNPRASSSTGSGSSGPKTRSSSAW
jgi:hypothetical protein